NHGLMDHPAHASDAFSKDVLERVAHRIADIEHGFGVDIRISIRDLREASEVDLSLHDLALKEFSALGLHRDDGRLGILLLILYHERKFYVMGDEGVHSKVHPE